jgi:putative FmdB family regulatory protein
MPTYTYKCPIHGEFEVEQRISDPKLQTCPRIMGDRLTLGRSFPCGSPVERLISPGTSFVLKGQGWAKDGYK